jgi:O-antigen/teichoic acid export membrane protein
LKSPSARFRSGGLDTFLVFATNAFTLGATIALQSLLARWLGTEGRGDYAILLLFGTSFGVFFTAGVDRASQYFSMSNRMPIWRALTTATLILVLGSTLSSLAAVPLIAGDVPFFNQLPDSTFYLALPLIPVSGMLTLFQLHAAGRCQFWTLAFAAVIQVGSNLALLILFLPILGWGASGAILAYAASAVVTTTYLGRSLARLERPLWQLKLSDAVEIMSYGLKYYVARVGNLIDLGMGTLLLSLVAPRADVGIYSAASALALKVLLPAESIETAALPRFAVQQNALELVAKCFRLSAVVTCLGVLLLCLLAPIVIPLLFSSAFVAGVGLVWAMALGLALQGGTKIVMAYYRATNRPGICSLSVWMGLCANCVAFFALYDRVGLLAAGYGMTIGFAARSLVLIPSFLHETKTPFLVLVVPKKGDLQLLGASMRSLLSRLSPAGP